MLSKNITIDQLFYKKYPLECNHTNLTLPDANFIFNSDPWSDEYLQELKATLNLQKSKLNNYDLIDWRNHTLRTNPAKDVLKLVRNTIKPELLTIAWMKFYECASNYDIVPEEVKVSKQFNTVHLCEAPGAFVTSLNHFLKLEYKDMDWKWLATTLNPYYEGNSMTWTVSDDRFMKHTLNNWNFGADYTGDIMEWNNAEYIINGAKQMGKVHLVTADGSIDCTLSPDEQESVVSSLHYCETIAALEILCEGGTFILKLFTIYEHQTINLIYLLAACFESVHFYKPVTSKPGNSEVYLICLSYVNSKIEPIIDKLKEYYGKNNFTATAMIPYDYLPKKFIDDLHYASYTYYYYQYCTIEENVHIFENAALNPSLFCELMKTQKHILKLYMKHYHLQPIDDSEKIVNENKYDNGKKVGMKNFQEGNYFERVNSSNLSIEERLLKINEKISLYENEFNSSPFSIESKTLTKHNFMYVYGKPNDKINTSCFVDSNLFKMYNELRDLLNFDKNSVLMRMEKICIKHIVYFQHFNFKDYYEGWEKHCIIFLIGVLKAMNTSDDLILNDFNLLLTQFGVGFLYLLACYGFDKLCFQDDQIHLKNLKYKLELIHKLENLKLELKSRSDQALLAIFHIEVLFTEEYFWAVFNYNNLRLYNYIVKHVN